MRTLKKIEATHTEVTIIKHYLDANELAFDAYRVGWSEGTANPIERRQPIAIRIGRSSDDGTFYLGDYAADHYVAVPYDQDFRVVRRADVPSEYAAIAEGEGE